MAEQIIPYSCGIHDGSFHADEVSACALLILFDLIDRKLIVRTRDQEKLEHCEYVCDIGGLYDKQKKRFDHHQLDYKGKFSSAGMVLDYLKYKEIISPGLYDFFYHSVIQGVDAYDTGEIKTKEIGCSFSQVIANFLPIEYEAPEEKRNIAFQEALDFVLGHLRRLKERFFYIQKCRDKVKTVMEKSGYYLVFDEPLAWLENFFDLGGEKHPALFVIMPSGPHWKLRCIPPSINNRMQVRVPLPLQWAGLRNDELKKESHIEGAVFCHKGRFISIWETKEAALEALEFVLKSSGVSR